MVLIKALIIPVIVFTISSILGMGDIGDGLALKVILILSAMPIGFTALVPPSIYNLDLDMANSYWLISNAALVIIIPLLTVLVPIV